MTGGADTFGGLEEVDLIGEIEIWIGGVDVRLGEEQEWRRGGGIGF